MPRKKRNNNILTGKKIRAARERAGFTIYELAKKIGVSYSAMCNYEMDRRVPSLQLLYDIADATNVSIMYLVTNSKDFTDNDAITGYYISKPKAVSLLNKIKKENRSKAFMVQIDDIIHCINENSDWGTEKKTDSKSLNIV